MSLSKSQQEDKEKYMRWFWIHERDLLWMAQRYGAWRNKAHELGFTDTKINVAWPHSDEGRLIRYTEIKTLF